MIDLGKNKITDEVFEILGSDHVSDLVLKIAEKVGLDLENQLEKFSRSIFMVVSKKISLENYPFLIQSELDVDEKTAYQLAVYVGKSFLVDNKKIFPEIDEYYQKWLAKAKALGVDFSRRAKPETAAKTEEKKAQPAVPEKTVSEKKTVAPATADKNAAAPAVTSQPAKKNPPQMADIKPAAAPKKESSAPAEFQFASAADLRSASPRILDQEPADAAKLIARFKEEIQDIANKSGATRPQIVAAWKDSQIYQAYVDMGNDSLQQGKNIEETAAFRKASGKPYLTEPQFNAVSEISRLLLH